MPTASHSVRPLHVSLIALPECGSATLHGLHDVLASFPMLAHMDEALPVTAPYQVEIVTVDPGPVRLVTGLVTHAHRSIAEVETTDVVIVPSVVLPREGWKLGRYPAMIDWLMRAHARGAMLCSACSGMFLLAETGLFDAREATIHYAYASAFSRVYPGVLVFPERALVVSGARNELVSSGASMSWHDLVLYLIARHVGATAAQAVAKFFALQWHQDGLGPYLVFEGRRDHGDAAVLAAQDWLERHFAVASPVDEVVKRSGLAERTFKRRFTEATGHAPLHYVQQLRVMDAKRRLERTREPVDEVGWRVGYEDPAFFRRLFKRVTGVSPAAYRKQFQVPGQR